MRALPAALILAALLALSPAAAGAAPLPAPDLPAPDAIAPGLVWCMAVQCSPTYLPFHVVRCVQGPCWPWPECPAAAEACVPLVADCAADAARDPHGAAWGVLYRGFAVVNQMLTMELQAMLQATVLVQVVVDNVVFAKSEAEEGARDLAAQAGRDAQALPGATPGPDPYAATAARGAAMLQAVTGETVTMAAYVLQLTVEDGPPYLPWSPGDVVRHPEIVAHLVPC